LLSPPYTALIVCLPTDSVDVVNVAWPVAALNNSGVSVPLSLNVTVPDASVPKLVTVAVKVTLALNAVVAAALSVRLVVVVALVTVCVRLFDVLPWKLLSLA